MDTFKRFGSLRRSKRNQKKNPPENGNGIQPPDSEVQVVPKEHRRVSLNPNYLSLRRPKGAKAYFTISFKDVNVNTNHGYQPTHLKAVLERRRKTRVSDPVLW